MPDERDCEELEKLIREQRAEQEQRYVYPERISQRRPVLFARLSARQKACLILSLFMRRSEIAEAFRIKPTSVSKYLKIANKKLPVEELQSLRAVKARL